MPDEKPRDKSGSTSGNTSDNRPRHGRLAEPVNVASDLRGVSQLAIQAVTGITDVAEGMYRNIAQLSPPVGKAPEGGARGIAGLVHRTVRGVTRGVGVALDASLALLTPLLKDLKSLPQREAAVAALNGVYGDHLVATHNRLAIPMQLRQEGLAIDLDEASLADRFDGQANKLLILVHGLCMNDLQWTRQGHDHGAALARERGYTPLYLHYNTGLPIGRNGAEFSALLAQLMGRWPAPLHELVIIGHSMGGLVTRSACHHAAQLKQPWLEKLDALVCLGTPHQGAPLERAGHWADFLMGISPYTAPFAGLTQARSAGIKDLRHGNLLNEETVSQARDEVSRTGSGSPAVRVSLPSGVTCHAIAATRSAQNAGQAKRLQGDGLVPVASALGQHALPERALHIPQKNQHVVYGTDHFGLLNSPAVFELLLTCLPGYCVPKIRSPASPRPGKM